MKILVSACLLGTTCRYDGKSAPCPAVCALTDTHTLIPVCPEQLGGLATPRPPAERQGTQVCTQDGVDVTANYHAGAQQTAQLAQLLGCDCAILKAKSPSCGTAQRYDGSFQQVLVDGAGVTCDRLRAQGLAVYSELDFAESGLFSV